MNTIFLRLALSLVISLPLCLSADDTPRVESSRDLLGEPTQVEEPKSERVNVAETCEHRIELGESKFSKPKGLTTVQVPIKNVCTRAMRLSVQTLFIKEDGSVVANPFPRATGGLEGMARGFVGLISLGASEMAIADSQDATIQTFHDLKPGETLTVEHQLPFPCNEVVGSRTSVATVKTPAEAQREKLVRKSQDQTYWAARDAYFSAKKEENQRWDRERRQLNAAKGNPDPMSEAYQKSMAHYWERHRAHMAILEKIEAQFKKFEAEQNQQLEEKL